MMKRRTFLKNTSLIGAGLTLLPSYLFQSEQSLISYEELIGKGHPKLFGASYKLRKEAHEAFLKLSSAARNSNIHIQVVSSYRSYAHQNRIWERKYKENINSGLNPTESIKKIIEYSTIPGTSRHHWGTDLDIIDGNAPQPANVLHPRHFNDSGCYSKLKKWMDKHANDYGFHLVYTNLTNRQGFKYEPWHYSYKPLSKAYLKAFQKRDLKHIITSEDLLGGDHFSDEFISNYLNQNILDINPELL